MRFLVVMLALFCGAGSARAYTPEGGVWWNPNEPGSGLQIEIQDNLLAMFGYVYDLGGNPTWVISAGLMEGNAFYEGPLITGFGGTCIGCPYRPHTELDGPGNVRIVFNPNDETRATLTWGGRTQPIERYHFYLKRFPDDGNVSGRLTKMLGEWQGVIDFSAITSSFPFSGEIFVLDVINDDELPHLLEGCRPDDSAVGGCSSIALRDHAAFAFIDAPTQRIMVLVDDSANSYALYELDVGTNHYAGGVSIYPKNGDPTTWHPVRGFRSASRTFVQEGVGPSSAKGAPAGTARTGLGEQLGLTRLAEGPSGYTPEIDAARLQPLLRQMEARLQERRGRR